MSPQERRAIIAANMRLKSPDPRTASLLAVLAVPLSKESGVLTEGVRFVAGMEMDSETARKVEHVVDWIAGAVVSNAGWLERLDRRGIPLKLAKLGSLDQAVREADKAMRRLASGGGVEHAGGTEIEMDLGDGWYLVRLTTPAALDLESARMGHCIGNGAYDDRLAFDVCRYLSLRDPQDRPHVTIEMSVARNEVLQCEGRGNKPPVRKHRERLREFMRNVRSSSWLAERTDFVEDDGGRRYHLDELPEELRIEGDLALLVRPGMRVPHTIVAGGKLSIRTDHPDVAIPLPTLVECGEFVAAGTLEFPLGSSVRARGAILMTGSTIVRMPDSLEAMSLVLRSSKTGPLGPGVAARSVDLSHATIEAYVPDVVPIHLNVTGAAIGRLREGLTIDGDARLNMDVLEAIPRGLRIKGNLVLGGWKPFVVPNCLHVEGKLLLNDCHPDTRFEDGSVVHGSLEIRKGGPTELPADMKVAYGCRLKETLVRNIGDGFEVGGDLFAGTKGSIAIGRGLSVGGWLELVAEAGISIGDDAKVGGATALRSKASVALGDRFETGASMAVWSGDYPGAATIGRGLFVGDAFAVPPTLAAIPPDTTIGVLEIGSGSPVAGLPSGLVVRSLEASASKLASLPDDLVALEADLPPRMYGMDLPAGIAKARFEADAEPDAPAMPGM